MREHGDPGERWHSRAKLPQDDKTPDTDHPRNNGLYRLSPSPPRLPPHSLSRPSYSNGFQSSGALSPTLTAYDQYSPQTEVPPSTRSGYGFGGGSPGGDVYWRNDVRDHSSPEDDLFCTCLGAHTYAALNHQLRGTINNLRQQPHTPTSGCRLYKRIVELNELLESVYFFPEYGKDSPKLIKLAIAGTASQKTRSLHPHRSGCLHPKLVITCLLPPRPCPLLQLHITRPRSGLHPIRRHRSPTTTLISPCTRPTFTPPTCAKLPVVAYRAYFTFWV